MGHGSKTLENTGLDSEDDLSVSVTIPETEESRSDEEIEVRNVPQTSSAKRYVWRNRKMSKSPNDVTFLGCKDLPNEFDDKETPIEYFKHFLQENILEEIVSALRS